MHGVNDMRCGEPWRCSEWRKGHFTL